jgi:hypothetical protein
MKLINSFFKIIIFMLLSNCAKKEELIPLVNFEKLNYVNVNASFCTSPPKPNKQKIKYIFILDHSASNQPGIPLFDSDVQSTDPSGSRRYGPMVNFVNNLADDPNNIITYNLINFNDAFYQPPGLNLSAVEADAEEFASIITSDWMGTSTDPFMPRPVDHGFTNYESALAAAKALILSDARIESASPDRPIVKSSYKIIFASDGIPRVSTTEVQQFDPRIATIVEEIVGIQDNPALTPFIASISLNTVYYFTDSATDTPEAEDILKEMADAGNGQFNKFGGNQSILYQIFAPTSRNLKNLFVDVFIENENVVWWEDGTIRQNNPGDGLPDAIKRQSGIKEVLRDSDFNGVSDLVEYRTKGRACNGDNCQSIQQDPYAICDGFDPQSSADGGRQYRSTAKDGFNDCEKFVLGASLDSFNSNGDFIPDFIKFKNQLPFVPGTRGSFANPFNDGFDNYSKIKKGLPISIAANKVFSSYKTRRHRLAPVESSDPSVDCYNLSVEDVATLSPYDVIRVWLVQNSAIVDDNPFVQIAEKPLLGSQQIGFSAEDFQ